MRTLFLIALLAIVGCRNVVGPFDARPPVRVDDPRFSIPEQEARGRQYLSLPDETPLSGPPSGAARPIHGVGRDAWR